MRQADGREREAQRLGAGAAARRVAHERLEQETGRTEAKEPEKIAPGNRRASG
jgi:hypothetical protein